VDGCCSGVGGGCWENTAWTSGGAVESFVGSNLRLR
jgi:hypothetical protein